MIRQVPAYILILALSVTGITLAGWQQPTYSVALPSHNRVGQEQVNSVTMRFEDAAAATVTVSASAAGDETLTHETTGDTLTTSYKLTGAAIDTPDAEWVPATTFAGTGRSYSLSGPADVTLWVRGQSAPDRANDAGTYCATLTMTVTW